jgi:hypothetical protein
MPEETIDEILKALTERFRKATSANFLPKVSFVKTGFAWVAIPSTFRIGQRREHCSEPSPSIQEAR